MRGGGSRGGEVEQLPLVVLEVDLVGRLDEPLGHCLGTRDQGAAARIQVGGTVKGEGSSSSSSSSMTSTTVV